MSNQRPWQPNNIAENVNFPQADMKLKSQARDEDDDDDGLDRRHGGGRRRSTGGPARAANTAKRLSPSSHPAQRKMTAGSATPSVGGASKAGSSEKDAEAEEVLE